MSNTLTFSDGHIEYWSTFSITHGLLIFDCPKKASQHMSITNDHFVRGIQFHKELNGLSMLSHD